MFIRLAQKISARLHYFVAIHLQNMYIKLSVNNYYSTQHVLAINSEQVVHKIVTVPQDPAIPIQGNAEVVLDVAEAGPATHVKVSIRGRSALNHSTNGVIVDSPNKKQTCP